MLEITAYLVQIRCAEQITDIKLDRRLPCPPFLETNWRGISVSHTAIITYKGLRICTAALCIFSDNPRVFTQADLGVYGLEFIFAGIEFVFDICAPNRQMVSYLLPDMTTARRLLKRIYTGFIVNLDVDLAAGNQGLIDQGVIFNKTGNWTVKQNAAAVIFDGVVYILLLRPAG